MDTNPDLLIPSRQMQSPHAQTEPDQREPQAHDQSATRSEQPAPELGAPAPYAQQQAAAARKLHNPAPRIHSIAIAETTVEPRSCSQEHPGKTCKSCSLRELCVPSGIPRHELEKLDGLVSTRRQLKRGQALFHSGDTFGALYAVRTGFFKTRIYGDEERTQVAGFQIPGDLLGLDGISSDRHNVDAIALDDSEVCVIPYDTIERLSIHCPSLRRQFQRALSCEIVKDHGVMLLLGNMRANERVAAFLLNLSERFSRLGYSPTEFNLRMTRDDIGSFLGLKVETVSRTFTRLQNESIISARGKEIKLIDIARLNDLLSSSR